MNHEDLKNFSVWIVWAEWVDAAVVAQANLEAIVIPDGRIVTHMTSAARSPEGAVDNVRGWITDGPTGLKTAMAYAVSSADDDVFGPKA